MRIVIAALIALFTALTVSLPAVAKTHCSKGDTACSTAKKSSYKKYKKYYKKKKYSKKRYGKKYSKRSYKKRYAKRYKKKRYSKKRYAKKRYAKKRYTKKRYSKKRYARSYKSGGKGRVGIASFYWQPQALASGGRFNPNALTAAHKSLPFGTLVKVTHLGNGRSVTVRINDRGPYIKGRIIDLSRRAAGVIKMRGQGIARVKIQVVGRSKKRRG